MKRPLHELHLDISLQAPYLVHGNDPGRHGLDATLMRDQQGRPILPGTLLAGRIVEAWLNLGHELDGADPETWFGRGGIESPRARLRVADLLLTDAPAEAQAGEYDIARIRLDDERGAVQHNALLLVEQTAAPGAALRFTGRWRAWAHADEAQRLARQIQAALLLQTQLGANRGIGFGRLLHVQVSPHAVEAPPLKLAADRSRHRLALSGDTHLCLAARGVRGNVFESDDHFSGGTLLGALAQMLMQRHGVTALARLDTPLARHFSRLRCTHAQPTHAPQSSQPGGGRPIPLPLSLVSLNEDIRDAWPHARPPAGLAVAPKFQLDWKSESATAGKTQGRPEPKRHLRVRTDIDGEGQAKDDHLFAYESIVSNANIRWLFDLDIHAVPEAERPDVREELAELLGHGLFPLGKTDAVLTVQPVPDDDPGAGPVWATRAMDDAIDADELIPIVLASDALLFPTDAIAEQFDPDLLAIYRAAFADLARQAGAADALVLEHHFASQQLAGGKYLHARFRHNQPYQPWVLTRAGSVFVFRINDPERARALLAQWAAHGLPLPPAVVAAYGDTWQDHPYLPQNGYGEIAIEPRHGYQTLTTNDQEAP